MIADSADKKIGKGEIDFEFDRLAAFLFEQYKKKQQADLTEKNVSNKKISDESASKERDL